MVELISRVLLTFAVVLLAAACGDDSPTAPSQPNTPTVTDTFTGTLNPNGARTHSFVAVASGSITSTLTSLVPDSTLRIGMALGTWNGSTCQLVVTNDNATQSSQVVGSITTVGGNFCVRVYDVGNLSGNVSYEVTVVHP
jgi:hypothetical protein